MNVGAIGTDQIQAMLNQIRSAAARPAGVSQPVATASLESSPSTKVDFSAALKSSLEQINSYQNKADDLGKKFALGDNSVGLSDVMIAGQKASISLQSAVQVRNKLVSAYQSVMNMQV